MWRLMQTGTLCSSTQHLVSSVIRKKQSRELIAFVLADIQNYQSVLHSAIFYPGDAINYTQANSTVTESYWLAAYSEAGETGPLTTAGDFYNYFVLGILPASYDPENSKWWPDYDGPTDDSQDNSTVSGPTAEERLCASGTPGSANWCLQSRGAQ